MSHSSFSDSDRVSGPSDSGSRSTSGDTGEVKYKLIVNMTSDTVTSSISVHSEVMPIIFLFKVGLKAHRQLSHGQGPVLVVPPH